MSLASGLAGGLARGLAGGLAGGGRIGDPTAITPANVDAFLTSLGLTQAGTGTTWGETGNDATPLYAVAAAKVPLAVETIGGKKYFGPIVNPAGTNLALYSSDATNAAWVKTGCTAALALGGLEHDADWRGTEWDVNGDFSSDAAGWTAQGTATVGATGIVVNGSGDNTHGAIRDSTIAPPIGGALLVELTVDDYVSGSPFPQFSGQEQFQFLDGSGNGIWRYILIRGNASGTIRIVGRGASNNWRVTEVNIFTVDAHTLITATADNATCLQSITSTSGERVSKFWASTDDEDVFVSHGAPDGSEKVTNGGFDADTDWTKGTGWAISGGVATHSAGTSSAIVQDVGVEPYKIHRCIVTVTGRTSGSLYWRIGNQTNVGIMSSNATFVQYLIAGSADTEIELFADATFDGSVDNVSVQKVSETELTPSTNPVPVDLAAYTGANPQLGIRIANNGDTARLYGVQHQVAARPLRPRIGPTAGSTATTGARSLTRTLGVAPTEIDIEMVFEFAGAGTNPMLFGLDDGTGNNRYLMFMGAGSLAVRLTVASSALMSASSGSLSNGTLYKVRYRAASGAYSVSLNDAAPFVSGSSAYTPPNTLALAIASATGSGGTSAGAPVFAFRDNLQNLLPAPYGWNARLLDNWS